MEVELCRCEVVSSAGGGVEPHPREPRMELSPSAKQWSYSHPPPEAREGRRCTWRGRADRGAGPPPLQPSSIPVLLCTGRGRNGISTQRVLEY